MYCTLPITKHKLFASSVRERRGLQLLYVVPWNEDTTTNSSSRLKYNLHCEFLRANPTETTSRSLHIHKIALPNLGVSSPSTDQCVWGSVSSITPLQVSLVREIT
ncbi:hypothetical protein PM082_021695 [Marasmius tenuissimus]|nr:hypothetical protein PM082_021695 [Marasmius tenuissimus]